MLCFARVFFLELQKHSSNNTTPCPVQINRWGRPAQSGHPGMAPLCWNNRHARIPAYVLPRLSYRSHSGIFFAEEQQEITRFNRFYIEFQPNPQNMRLNSCFQFTMLSSQQTFALKHHKRSLQVFRVALLQRGTHLKTEVPKRLMPLFFPKIKSY